jgi:hypothetical protein
MSTQEITGAVINSRRVTNDATEIDAALCWNEAVDYVTRDQAKSMAQKTGRADWASLAGAPAMIVVIDGIRYRRSLAVPSVNMIA